MQVLLTVLTIILRSLAAPGVRIDDFQKNQELLGRKDVETTMTHINVLNRQDEGVKSPADDL